jgi:preprotein translocase subunit YajC
MLESLSFTMPLGQLGATTLQGDAAPAVPATSTPVMPAGTPIAATQATTMQSGAATEPAAIAKPTSPYANILQFALIGGMFLVLYLVMFRGQKKTEKTRKQMLSAMKKGDEVMTIGGMVARIVSIDEDEVVLKIDESANVKARYKKSAIQQVLTAEDKAK